AAARARHFLIIGPWDHPGTRTPTDEVGGVKFGPGAIVDLNDLHRQWYDWAMKNGAKPQFLKNQVAYYLLAAGNSGANGEWKYTDSYANLIANPKTFYLDSKNGDANGVFRSGFLAENQPNQGADEYINDPLDIHRGVDIEGVEPNEKTGNVDQRFALCIGPDGLVYHSEPLAKETPLIGCPKVSLWVSIDTQDTDLEAELNLLAEKLQLRGRCGLRNRERRAHRAREGLSRRRARKRDRLAVALMRLTARVLIVPTFFLLTVELPAASEIVIAIRYLQAEGTSHSHLYLYREDGKILRQLTTDNSGQDVDPIFAPDGEVIA